MSTFKLLGVTFDAQLTFKTHINNIIKNYKSTLNLLRAISGTSWGAQTEKMLMVYKALSSLEYTTEAIHFPPSKPAAQYRYIKSRHMCCPVCGCVH